MLTKPEELATASRDHEEAEERSEDQREERGLVRGPYLRTEEELADAVDEVDHCVSQAW